LLAHGFEIKGMVKLFGQTLTRRQIAERCGALSQFAGVRLMTLGDGVERGVRMLEFRTGSGLRFTVLIDRAFDIADFEFKGQAVGWHSASGFRHPGLREYEGEQGLAWARSFSGFLLTCGLDHILGPEETPAAAGQEDGAACAARPSEHDPGAARRLWRAMGGRSRHSLGGRRGAASRGLWRRPSPHSSDRSRCRGRRNPAF
jgi:hypothetical protein